MAKKYTTARCLESARTLRLTKAERSLLVLKAQKSGRKGGRGK